MLFTNEQILGREPAELLGDWHPLVSQLGSTEGLSEFASIANLLCVGPIESEKTLRKFLIRYHEELMLPVELPAIRRAYDHACGNELRELIAFDQEGTAVSDLRELRSSSRRVGQAQLRRLKPLRDSRFVQRYLRAVEDGRADAWHTLVFGVTLAVYSLPLRQGLLHYAAETMRGFVQMACRSFEASEDEIRTMLDERFALVVQELERTVPLESDAQLRVL